MRLTPYGGGNAPISHMHNFLDFGGIGKALREYKDDWNRQQAEIEACLKASDDEGKAIQITLTDSQLSYDPQYVGMIKDWGFVQVFKHKNPNTGRIIYTYMRHPVSEKKIGTISGSYPLKFWEDLYSRNTRLEQYRVLRGYSNVLNFHGGSCCGWSSCWGINPYDSTTIEFHKHLASVLGGIQLDTKGMAWQFALPKTVLYSDNDHTGWVNIKSVICLKGGFREVFNFVNPLTRIAWVMLAKSENEIE